VIRDRCATVSIFLTVILTPGTNAPEASATNPSMSPVIAAHAPNEPINNNATAFRICLLDIFPLPSELTRLYGQREYSHCHTIGRTGAGL
jgi:hypothetical protein